MGTDETAMAWVRDEIRRSVGLSSVLGGIPLDQVGATGYGLAVCAETAQEFVDVDLKGARVTIQGFGNVGQHAARYLVNPKRGAIVIAASDRDGTIYNSNGLDVEELCEHIQEHHGVTGFPGGEVLPINAFETLECDIFVPAAQPDVINADNAGTFKCKLILQGANIPATQEAEQILHDRGIVFRSRFCRQCGRRHLWLRRIPGWYQEQCVPRD